MVTSGALGLLSDSAGGGFGFFSAARTPKSLWWAMALQLLAIYGGISSWLGLSTVWVILFQILSLVAAWQASDCLNKPSQRRLE